MGWGRMRDEYNVHERTALTRILAWETIAFTESLTRSLRPL